MTGFPRDGLNRRSLLTQCAGWAGAGVLYTLTGGIAPSISLDAALSATPHFGRTKPFTFLQISDTHIGFDKSANPNARGTAMQAVEKIKALPHKPDLIIHTGDITHLSTDAQFDDAREIFTGLGSPI